MAKIRYIGKKPRRADTMYGTGLVWNGPGDVQTCTDAGKAALLLRHADMFELAGEGAAPAPASTAAAVTPQVMLIGTDVLGSTIHLSENTGVLLSDVVRSAFEESGLSVELWNALPQQERTEQILKVVERARAHVARAAAASGAAGQATVTTASQGEATQQSASGEGAGADGAAPVYRMATESGPLDLTQVGKDDLRKLCKSLGLAVSNNAGEDTLRKKLAEAFPVAQG